MKKTLCILTVCLLLTCFAGCEVSYYHEESSLTPSTVSVEDSVPPYVFGEKGFYDTVADAEFLRADGVFAIEKGDVYISDGEHVFYMIVGVHESYMLCDENGAVYKNCAMPWAAEPFSDGFAEAHPALRTEEAASDTNSSAD